jgi:hypothetical protein
MIRKKSPGKGGVAAKTVEKTSPLTKAKHITETNATILHYEQAKSLYNFGCAPL